MADSGGLSRLGEAISFLTQKRAAALEGAARSAQVASALDRADAACATGIRDRCRSARPSTPTSAVVSALRRLTEQIDSYANARAELSAAAAAAPALSAEQQAALERVVATGGAEITALSALRRQASRVWPAFRKLDRVQARWLERRTAGWYRSRDEAADAYAVLTDQVRATLAVARPALASADVALTGAMRAMNAALAQADRALATLRPSGGPDRLAR